MSELTTGLAESSNSPQADTPATIDTVLDTAFDPSPSDATAAPESPTTSTPAPEPAAATVQPPGEIKTEGAKGEPPRERWDTILANARTKAREDTLAEHRGVLELVQRLRDDFPGTMAQLLEEGAADPRFAESLTSRAAAILSARNKAAKADSEPEPDLQTTDGALVYSADQLRKWQTWNARQTEGKLLERFQPLQQLQERFQQHEQLTQEAQKIAAITERRGAQWKAMPLFEDHKSAILARQQELYDASKDQPGFDPTNAPWELLQQAYSEIVSTQALPKLQTQQTEALVAAAARKRAGSASDPAASAPAQPRKPRTVDEALDQVFNAVSV